MPTVRYDDRSLMIDGQRVWLASGAIHYFRVPRQLWHDRILKAKRAGLNCIETYVAWNVHEPQPGQWEFTGDHNIVEFVSAARDLDMYVILRPGPYICAECDFGGLPAWLATKPGIALRTSNATYSHYFDKYLGQVLMRLADLQVTRGGNIILIQNENEYFYTTMPDRLAYLEFISQLFRRSGFDIPILTCNGLSEPRVPGTIECYNGYGNEVEFLKRLRTAQPDAPLLATEYWTGNFDWWGGPHHVKDAREVARRSLEMLGCACQVNYYMFHGGTNFGFGGSRLASGEAAWQTTSYDYDAPLAEGGGLTDKYYSTRLVNMLATGMGAVLAQSRMEGPGVTVHSGTQALNAAGPGGRIAVITNNGRDQITLAAISLPDGRRLDVSLEPLGATAVPIGVRLDDEHVLDYANLMPLGVFGRVLALHGPPGFAARISVNGHELQTAVPADKPALLEHQGQPLLLMSSRLAMRSWEVEGALAIGPEYVGDSLDEAVAPKGMAIYHVLSAAGLLEAVRYPHPPPKGLPAAPRLGAFARVCISTEPMEDDLAWQPLDRPKDPANFGVNQGYVWYRLRLQAEKPVIRQLFLPECDDRALAYLNGQLLATWGRGPGAACKPIPVALKHGLNTLVFLSDNLGRDCYGPNLGAPKGIYGPAWDARPLRLPPFKVSHGADFSRRLVPRMMAHLVPSFEAGPLWTVETSFSLPKVSPIHLSYTDLPHHVIVQCNGRVAAFLPNAGGYGQVTLGSELQKGKNVLRLIVCGQVDQKKLAGAFDAVQLLEKLSGTWSWRRWEMPSAGRVVGKDLPAWYASRFTHKPTSLSLFLRLVGTGKGQIFLNAHNVGRFWGIGPQEYYYLPEPWLAEENELLIFDEHGLHPSNTRLAYLPGGPYQAQR